MSRSPWRFLRFDSSYDTAEKESVGGDAPAASGAENMAIDHALLESVQAGGRPTLRFYRWRPPCLSLGRNQSARTAIAGRAAHRGWDLVRRPTGGAAVLHDRELTYAVALPLGLLGSPRQSYAELNRALLAGLAELSVVGELATAAAAGAAPAPDGPCFRSAAPGELVSAGRKLVGSAQRCERKCLLQHGSILLEGDQSEVAEVLGGPGTSPVLATATTSLAEILGAVPPWDALVSALLRGFHRTLGIGFAPAGLTPVELARTRELADHYRAASWTWRR